jgi:HD-like signal output (HDOD) protein
VNPATAKLLQRKVSDLGNLPAMPTILQPLGECLSGNPSDANLHRVVELISYDKSITAQCLRMANSPLLRGRADADSIKSAVFALGLRRIRDIVYSCSIPQLFAGAKNGMAPDTFWRHAMGVALVSQHLAKSFAFQNPEKLYLAGLLHDMGILVNSLLFEKEFLGVLDIAKTSEAPLVEIEQEMLGFTHCDSGRVLADIWKLPVDISGVIEFHHHPSTEAPDEEMTCVIFLADLLCRLRGLGYGYYEAREFDLASQPAWRVLQKKYPAAAVMDLARFTFELDQYAIEVQQMVDNIFAVGAVTR